MTHRDARPATAVGGAGAGVARRTPIAPASVRGVLVLIGAVVMWGLIAPPGVAAVAAESTPGSTRAAATLRVGMVTDGEVTDWLDCTDPLVCEVWALTHEPLAGCSVEDCSPEPRFAESWSVSADGLVWTFRIRAGMRWHDGETADARDAAFTYRLAMDQGAPVLSGSLAGVASAEAVDDRTLRIVCSRPRVDLLTLRVPILPAHLWRDVEIDRVRARGPRLSLMVGTGPYRCDEWTLGEYVRLLPVAGAHAREAPDEVLLLRFADRGKMVHGLRAGLLDAAFPIPPGQLAGLRKQRALETIEFPGTAWTHLTFNCRGVGGHPALADPAFRRALAWAVDKETIVRLAFLDRARPGVTAVSPAGYGAAVRWSPEREETIGADEETAARLLDEAGYIDTDGDGIREHGGRPIELRLWTSAASKTGQRCGKLLAAWFERLGLRIRLEVLEQEELAERVLGGVGDEQSPAFDMVVGESVGAADPGRTLERFSSALGGADVSGWVDAEYDRLAAAQRVEIDADVRAAMLRSLQQILYEECPQVALAYPVEAESYNVARWTGWIRTPRGSGPAFFGGYSVASYLGLRRVVAPQPGPSSEGGQTTALVVGGGIVAMLAAIAGGLLYRRRRGLRGASDGSEPS